MTLSLSGRTVTVRLYPERQTFFGLSQSGTVNFEAVLPASFDGIITVSGSSDNISIRSFDVAIMHVEAGNAKINVSSGDVQLGRTVADTLEIKLSSGDLVINTLDSNKTKINTTGETDIKSARGEIKLEGSSGEVDLTLSALDAPVSMDVSSGDISITLPEGSAFDVRLDTSSGRIHSEFPVLGDLTAGGDELKGTVNGSGVPVTVNTSSGDIKLLTR